MAGAITRDPREYRRGMVLGLTLAETLLLLLFLLLLATATLLLKRDARVQQAETAMTELRPLLEELRRQGVTVQDAAELAAKLRRGEAAVAESERLREQLAAAETLRTQAEGAAAEARRRREEAEQLAARLQREVNESQSSRQALAEAQTRAQQAERRLQEAEQIVARLEQDASQAQARLTEAQARSASLETQIDAERGGRQAEIARGMIAAGVYPSCWGKDGQPEHAFHVQLRTEGRIVVEDRAPPYRQQQEPWKSLAPFPRNVPIDVSVFVAATRQMAEWSQRQEPACRFWITARRDMSNDVPNSEYLRVIGPLGNAATRHVPFYRIGG